MLVTFRGLLHAIPRTLTAAAIATVLALALNPVVQAAEHVLRHVRRSVAVSAVVVGFALGVVLLSVLLVPPAVREARQLGDAAAEGGQRPRQGAGGVGDDLVRNDVPAKVQRWVEKLPEQLSGHGTAREGGPVVGRRRACRHDHGPARHHLLLEGERLVRAMRRLVPAQQRTRADHAAASPTKWSVATWPARSSSRVLRGVVVLIVGLRVGVPLTPLAAAWVAVRDLVPQIGGAAGGVPSCCSR